MLAGRLLCMALGGGLRFALPLLLLLLCSRLSRGCLLLRCVLRMLLPLYPHFAIVSAARVEGSLSTVALSLILGAQSMGLDKGRLATPGGDKLV